jgi:hypothetical protein
MQAWEVASMDVVALCGYNNAGAGLLLIVERNTLLSSKGVMVAGRLLSSSAAPNLGAVAMGDRVRLTMACNIQIAVLWSVALMVADGMVLFNVRRTLHAARTVRSAADIVSIMQWLGYCCHVSATQQQWVVGM